MVTATCSHFIVGIGGALVVCSPAGPEVVMANRNVEGEALEIGARYMWVIASLPKSKR
jgi:hypothetical protein